MPVFVWKLTKVCNFVTKAFGLNLTWMEFSYQGLGILWRFGIDDLFDTKTGLRMLIGLGFCGRLLVTKHRQRFYLEFRNWCFQDVLNIVIINNDKTLVTLSGKFNIVLNYINWICIVWMSIAHKLFVCCSPTYNNNTILFFGKLTVDKNIKHQIIYNKIYVKYTWQLLLIYSAA